MNNCKQEKDKKSTIEEQKKQFYENLVREYCLKSSVFNPWKNSPNVFLNKLQFRIKNYYKECQLDEDPLMI